MSYLFKRFCNSSALTFLFAVCFASGLSAQDKTLDSLQLVLKNAAHDTVRVKALSAISEVCDMQDLARYATECSTLCGKALLAEKQPRRLYQKGLADALKNMGSMKTYQGDYPGALDFYKRSLALEEQLGNKKDIAYGMNSVALVLFYQGEFSKALEYFFRNLKILEQIGDQRGQVFSLNNIGSVYSRLGEPDKALEYLAKALAISKKAGNKAGMSQCIQSMGLIHSETKDYKKALGYFEQSLALYKELQDPYGLANAYGAIGSCYMNLDENEKALDYLSSSREIAEKNGFMDLSGQALQQMANAYRKEGKMELAMQSARKGMDIAKALGDVQVIESAADVLFRVYEKQGRYKEALEMYRLEVKMRDSTMNESNRKVAMKQELQYEYEKKELQVKLMKEKELSDMKIENERKLARRNTILYIVLSLAVLLGISIFFLYKFYKQRNIINASRNNELRRKLLLNQMNPHFIFNSVDNIQSLIHNKQDQEAISYLGKFSKLTRQILENSNEEMISLSEELNTLENYLTIQQLLYNNSFTFTIKVDEPIDKENVFLPPMLTQPFVENAIKHGLKNKKEGGKVKLKFFMKDRSLFFEVSDNGSGLEEKTGTGHKSMSTRIVTERLNTAAKKPIEIRTRNLVENNEVIGVITTFEIPYICDN